MKVFSRNVVRVIKYTLLETDTGDVKIYPDGTVEYHEDDGDGDCEWVKLDPNCEMCRVLRDRGYLHQT